MPMTTTRCSACACATPTCTARRESQLGAHHYGHRSAVVEMGGRDVERQDHMVTEVLIRAFYKHYREVMGLYAGPGFQTGSKVPGEDTPVRQGQEET